MTRILIFGASSGPGAALFVKLAGQGRPVIGVGRDAKKMADVDAAADVPLTWIVSDMNHAGAMEAALEGATTVINCGANRWVHGILRIAGDRLERLITLGSTRLYSKVPDPRTQDMREVEEAALNSGVPATVLHPTLIYGWWWGNPSVPRILHMVKSYPFVPLPGGGKALLQPIFHKDVALCLEAALDRSNTVGKAITIAGPKPLPYADFIRACASHAGLRARILGVPGWMAVGLAALSRAVPGLPSADSGEIKRLMEDKVFDINNMTQILGVTPRSLNEGLSQMFKRREGAV